MRRKRLAALAGTLAITAVLAGGAPAEAAGKRFHVRLSGAQEVPPNPHGDADRGSVFLTLNQGRGRVCARFGSLTLTPGEPLPFAGHIHVAPRGQAGPVVVTLFSGAAAPTRYPTGTMCTSASRDLVKAIRKHPARYYVNLHNDPHPTGVVRGQLR